MKLKFTLELKNYLNMKSQTIQEYSRKKMLWGSSRGCWKALYSKTKHPYNFKNKLNCVILSKVVS